MPHTFNNNHTIRRSHNAIMPVNHKTTRMHTKVNLNRPRIYFDDPKFVHLGNDITLSVQWVKDGIQETKNRLSYLKELKDTYPDSELIVNVKERSFHMLCPPSCQCDFICYPNLSRLFYPIDELIDTYTSYCENVDAELDELESELESMICSSHQDYAILPKTHKKTSHRISRERSLPASRLERQIKKQIFFKKSRKVDEDPIEEESMKKEPLEEEPMKMEPMKKEPIKTELFEDPFEDPFFEEIYDNDDDDEEYERRLEMFSLRHNMRIKC